LIIVLNFRLWYEFACKGNHIIENFQV
jgi:hypothetical protein